MNDEFKEKSNKEIFNDKYDNLNDSKLECEVKGRGLTSGVGLVYKYERGVVVISVDGISLEENLDLTSDYHGPTTIRLANQLGANESNEKSPFPAGKKCSDKGFVVMQFIGDNCYAYLPQSLTEFQLDELSLFVQPRKEFHYYITYDDYTHDEKTSMEFMDFALNKTGNGLGENSSGKGIK